MNEAVLGRFPSLILRKTETRLGLHGTIRVGTY